MSLERLPPELISKICSYLVKSFGPSPIHALLRTSKQLYDVALPFSVQIFRNTTPMHVGGGPCSKNRNVQFLRYILISKPELAEKVDTIILGGFTVMEDRGSQTAPDIIAISTKEELDVYEYFIINALGPQLSGFDLGRRDQWIAHLEEGHSDAQAALILLACSNVKSLYFEDYEEESPNRMTLMKPPCFLFLLEMAKTLSASIIPGVRAPLWNIEHVQVQSQKYNTFGWEQAFRLMALPKLKVYESLNTTSNGYSPRDLANLPEFSTVEHVSLHHSHASTLEVKSLLGTCQHLKEFEYIGATLKSIGSVSARGVMEAILPHAETLTSLHLNFPHDSLKSDWHNDPHQLSMGIEFAQMITLGNLDIGMQSLTGMYDPGPVELPHRLFSVEGAPRIVQCLPRNLVKLSIRDCGKAILDQAAELLNTIERGEKFERLRCIKLVFNAESIDIEDVQQRLPVSESNRYSLMILFQPMIMRWVDSGKGSMFPGIRVVPSLCSRIFADDLRKDWIDFRGVASQNMYYTKPGCSCLPYDRVDVRTRVARLMLINPPHEYQLDD